MEITQYRQFLFIRNQTSFLIWKKNAGVCRESQTNSTLKNYFRMWNAKVDDTIFSNKIVLSIHWLKEIFSASVQKTCSIRNARLTYFGFCVIICLRFHTGCFPADSRCGIPRTFYGRRIPVMRHIQTIETRDLCESAKKGGCGECQTSCQSACKTSCGIANQQCESKQKAAK